MKEFENIIDSFRPNHLWKKENDVWQLKKPIWGGKNETTR